MNIYRSSSSAETKRLGRELAKKILRDKKRAGAAIVALDGELGVGKTTLAQGFAAGLGVRGKVSSPTFILMRVTKIKSGNFIHIDAYRAESKDFLKLGFKKLAADPQNVILIEWAGRIKKILPKSAVWMKLAHGRNESERTIAAAGKTKWKKK